MGWLFSSSSFDTSKSMKCFNNELYGKCGGCEYMNSRNYSSGLFSGYSYKCVKKGGYYKWNDRVCYSVEYVDPEKIDCCERYKDFTGRKYFILSAISEILGFSLDNRLFTEIIALTDIVRSDESTAREAIGYDAFGPEIADMLRMDRNRVELCNYLLYNYLVKVYSLIDLKKEEEAIKLYEDMVRFLFYRYRNMENQSEIIDAQIFENAKIKIK